MSSDSRIARMRWGVRAVLALGVAASVTANVLHARPNPISQTIAGWPPIALLLTVELISRIPVRRRGLAAVRIVATVLIAGIAAWVSYWHMTGAAARYGETGASAYLLPLSVDGLIVVASICLVELGHLTTTPAPTHEPANLPARGPNDEASDNAHQPQQNIPPAPSNLHADAAADPPGSAATALPEPAAFSATPNKRATHRTATSPASKATATARRQTATKPLEPTAAYEPTTDDDDAMYQVWLRGIADGREPSGADLARAAGRADDTTGIGRRAARRYRDAHAATSPQTTAAMSL